MKKKNVIISILILLFAIFLIPICIDWCIIGSHFPSNISNSDWVSFLGGYVGAIIGAAMSLLGIIITIRYTNKQNRLDRELQVRPYCSIRYVHEDTLHGTDKVLGNFVLACEPKENNGPRYTSVLYIKNVGIGPALDFTFEIDQINDGREHYPVLLQRTEESARNTIHLLQAGEEGALPIMIWFNFDPVQDKEIIDFGEDKPFRYGVSPSIMNKYRNFDISIKIKYCDMFQTQYMQKVLLQANMYMSIGKEKTAEHKCDVILRDLSVPTKISAIH